MKIAAVSIYDEFCNTLHHEVVSVPEGLERVALMEMISRQNFDCTDNLLCRITEVCDSQLHNVLLEEFDLVYSVIFIEEEE